ncbi:hypothetical protein T492DRAFT_833034 [Pavlovales sp. CCMP2436]|nr:hypothetical protein T492DRAFT_833034 [Pavlovales sp. CCMP2436]
MAASHERQFEMAAEEDGGEGFDTPPAKPPAPAKRAVSRIRMDPTYAAALRQLCEPSPASALAEPGGETTRGATQRVTEWYKWAEQYRLLVNRELLMARAVLPPDAMMERELAADVAPALLLARERAGDRAGEEAVIAAGVSELRESVSEARELMQRASAGPSYIRELQAAVERVEECISVANAEHARTMAALARAEEALSAELDDHATNFDVWPTLAPPRPAAGARPTTAPGRGSRAPPAAAGLGGASAASAVDFAAAGDGAHPELSAAIARLDAQLDRLGGATVGWPEEEHAVFLRVRSQLGSPPLAALKLNTITDGELRAHAAGCAAREELLEEKRAAVSAWRGARETSSAQRVERERAIEVELRAREDAERQRVEAAAARARDARDAELGRWKERKEAGDAAAQEAQEVYYILFNNI